MGDIPSACLIPVINHNSDGSFAYLHFTLVEFTFSHILAEEKYYVK